MNRSARAREPAVTNEGPADSRPLRTALAAVGRDLAPALSLGLCWTVTYNGRAHVSLPGTVALGAPFMYYVGVDDRSSTVVQAWLWMLCFPLAGRWWRSYWPRALSDSLLPRCNDRAAPAGRNERAGEMALARGLTPPATHGGAFGASSFRAQESGASR